MSIFINWLNDASMDFTHFMSSQLFQWTLLTVMAMGAIVLLRRSKPVFRYWLWVIVVSRLLLPPGAIFPTSVSQWGNGLMPSIFQISPDALKNANSNGVIGGAFDSSGWTITPAAGTADGMMNAPRAVNWQVGLMIFWMAGVIFWGGMAILKIVRFSRRVSRGAKPPLHIWRITRKLRRRIGIKRPVAMVVMLDLESPVVGGVFRPVIALPEYLIGDFNEKKCEAILLHELVHVKRLDWLINWLQVLAGVIYWFWPLLWLVNRQLRRERELTCDDVVLSTPGIQKKTYAGGLLDVLERSTARSIDAVGLIGVVEKHSSAGKRLRRILTSDYKPHPRLSVGSAVALLVFAFCFSTFGPVSNADQGTNTDANIKVTDENKDALSSQSKQETIGRTTKAGVTGIPLISGAIEVRNLSDKKNAAIIKETLNTVLYSSGGIREANHIYGRWCDVIPDANLILYEESEENIERIHDFLKTANLAITREFMPRVYYLQYAAANSVKDNLIELLNESGRKGLEKNITVIPRLNALAIESDKSIDIDELSGWIETLDVAPIQISLYATFFEIIVTPEDAGPNWPFKENATMSGNNLRERLKALQDAGVISNLFPLPTVITLSGEEAKASIEMEKDGVVHAVSIDFNSSVNKLGKIETQLSINQTAGNEKPVVILNTKESLDSQEVIVSGPYQFKGFNEILGSDKKNKYFLFHCEIVK